MASASSSIHESSSLQGEVAVLCELFNSEAKNHPHINEWVRELGDFPVRGTSGKYLTLMIRQKNGTENYIFEKIFGYKPQASHMDLTKQEDCVYVYFKDILPWVNRQRAEYRDRNWNIGKIWICEMNPEAFDFICDKGIFAKQAREAEKKNKGSAKEEIKQLINLINSTSSKAPEVQPLVNSEETRQASNPLPPPPSEVEIERTLEAEPPSTGLERPLSSEVEENDDNDSDDEVDPGQGYDADEMHRLRAEEERRRADIGERQAASKMMIDAVEDRRININAEGVSPMQRLPAQANSIISVVKGKSEALAKYIEAWQGLTISEKILVNMINRHGICQELSSSVDYSVKPTKEGDIDSAVRQLMVHTSSYNRSLSNTPLSIITSVQAHTYSVKKYIRPDCDPVYLVQNRKEGGGLINCSYVMRYSRQMAMSNIISTALCEEHYSKRIESFKPNKMWKEAITNAYYTDNFLHLQRFEDQQRGKDHVVTQYFGIYGDIKALSERHYVSVSNYLQMGPEVVLASFLQTEDTLDYRGSVPERLNPPNSPSYVVAMRNVREIKTQLNGVDCPEAYSTDFFRVPARIASESWHQLATKDTNWVVAQEPYVYPEGSYGANLLGLVSKWVGLYLSVDEREEKALCIDPGNYVPSELVEKIRACERDDESDYTFDGVDEPWDKKRGRSCVNLKDNAAKWFHYVLYESEDWNYDWKGLERHVLDFRLHVPFHGRKHKDAKTTASVAPDPPPFNNFGQYPLNECRIISWDKIKKKDSFLIYVSQILMLKWKASLSGEDTELWDFHVCQGPSFSLHGCWLMCFKSESGVCASVMINRVLYAISVFDQVWKYCADNFPPPPSVIYATKKSWQNDNFPKLMAPAAWDGEPFRELEKERNHLVARTLHLDKTKLNFSASGASVTKAVKGVIDGEVPVEVVQKIVKGINEQFVAVGATDE